MQVMSRQQCITVVDTLNKMIARLEWAKGSARLGQSDLVVDRVLLETGGKNGSIESGGAGAGCLLSDLLKE